MQRWGWILRGSLQMMIWNVPDYNMGQMGKNLLKMNRFPPNPQGGTAEE